MLSTGEGNNGATLAITGTDSPTVVTSSLISRLLSYKRNNKTTDNRKKTSVMT